MIRNLEALLHYQIADPVMHQALNQAWQILTDTREAREIGEFALCIYNPDFVSDNIRNSHYATPACQAIYTEKLIVINESFLFEIESAVRAFDLSDSLVGSQYLSSDRELEGLIRRINGDPHAHIQQYRKLEKTYGYDSVTSGNPFEEMVLAIFFFLSHEVGHLLHKHEQANFSSFFDPSMPLEARVSHAVARFCRHADEFDKLGFGLDDFQSTCSPESMAVRQSTIESVQPITGKIEQDEQWYHAEIDADSVANRMMLRYLDQLTTIDPCAAERQEHYFFRVLFVVGLYFWHKDLYGFSRALGLDSVGLLTGAMMKNRQQYVRAASLFGDVHRFILLRAVQAMDFLIANRTDHLKVPRTIWCRYSDEEVEASGPALADWRICENLQRFHLLSIMMDTAVKLASHGSATPFLLEADERRGTPQFSIMHFESLQQAVRRLGTIG